MSELETYIYDVIDKFADDLADHYEYWYFDMGYNFDQDDFFEKLVYELDSDDTYDPNAEVGRYLYNAIGLALEEDWNEKLIAELFTALKVNMMTLFTKDDMKSYNEYLILYPTESIIEYFDGQIYEYLSEELISRIEYIARKIGIDFERESAKQASIS